MDRECVIQRRTLSDSLLYFPVQGRLWCRVGDKEKVLGPGELLMVPEGVEHEAHREVGDEEVFEAYSIHAHAYTAQNRPLLSLFTSPFARLPGVEGWFQQLALLTHMLGRDQDVGRRYGEMLVRSLLLQQLAGENPLTELPVADDPRAWTATLYILRHYDETVSVRFLARRAGISTVQFRKLFKQYTGVPPSRYIQEVRLRKAWVLLRTNPQVKVQEVAEQTGFGGAHYLHAAFKKKFGMTPRQCRTMSKA